MGYKTDQIIVDFLDRLSCDFQLQHIILFGSRATNTHLKNSDYDLLIVSPDFSGISFVDRISIIYRYWQSDIPLEPLCYTPEEFAKKSMQIGIVNQAVKFGVKIPAA